MNGEPRIVCVFTRWSSSISWISSSDERIDVPDSLERAGPESAADRNTAQVETTADGRMHAALRCLEVDLYWMVTLHNPVVKLVRRGGA